VQHDTESTKFVLADVPRDHVDDVLSFGFEAAGEAFTRSFPGDLRHLDSAFANFQRIAEEMVLQHAGLRPVPWESALDTFIERIDRENMAWVLIGGASLAARGVEIVPGDVDIVTDIGAARRLDDLFLDSLVEPTREIPGFGWFGRAFPDARLEWLGNEPGASGVWSLSSVQFETVEWRGRPLRVPPLAVCLRIEEARGRMDRVEAIRRVTTS
jgi:hypothetical protein